MSRGRQLFGYIEDAGRPHGHAPGTQPIKQPHHTPTPKHHNQPQYAWGEAV